MFIFCNNDISLDLLVKNIGELDADGTVLRFYLNDTQGELLKEISVPSLCSQETPGCTIFSQDYPSVSINNEGIIYQLSTETNRKGYPFRLNRLYQSEEKKIEVGLAYFEHNKNNHIALICNENTNGQIIDKLKNEIDSKLLMLNDIPDSPQREPGRVH